jgi:hypothetical protein
MPPAFSLRVPRPVLIYAALFATMTGFCLAVGAWLEAAFSALCLAQAAIGVVACETSSADAVRRAFVRLHIDAMASAVLFRWRVNHTVMKAIPSGVLDVGQLDDQLAAQPARQEGLGYLYVIQFASGVVKVGQTVEPRTRLAKHRRDAEAFGVPIVGLWLSPPHTNFVQNEIALIEECLKISQRYKNEFFYSTDLDAVVKLATGLVMAGAPAAGAAR